jgi:hypothetical protein
MEGCTASEGGIFEVFKSFDFGVGFSGTAMPSVREDFSVF